MYIYHSDFDFIEFAIAFSIKKEKFENVDIEDATNGVKSEIEKYLRAKL